MRNSGNTRSGRRQPCRTIVAIVLFLYVSAVVATIAWLSQSATTQTRQADKVQTASNLLLAVGFHDPVYLGITKGSEGQFPTFRVTAIGGKPVDVWIRTMRDGGFRIQPTVSIQWISSADDLARQANMAVETWKHRGPDTLPSKDGSFGPYESMKYNYEQLARYNPGDSYWDGRPNETAGWPTRP